MNLFQGPVSATSICFKTPCFGAAVSAEFEIRARFDRDTIIVYQAYARNIAEPALRQQRFVSPFSFEWMTWIKPSFLWLMHRSNWGQKKGQEHTLAVHVTRAGRNKALSLGVLTHPEPSIYPRASEWDRQFQAAQVHVQWDTERSLRGAALNHFSIQVGISRHVIREYVDEWIVKIEDLSQAVSRMRQLLHDGRVEHAKRLLPLERIYPLEPQVGRRIGAT